LFSAAVATLLGVTIPDLKPNSQDISASHLEKILQILADPNVSHTVTPSTLTKQSTFSPQNYSVWVNLLWFLSLTLSLICALLATSLQQWTRRYIRITQPPRLSPHARARIRAFFSDGIDKSHLTNPVEVLPLLLHLSLFLFFAGLLIYLFNINRIVAIAVACCVGLFAVVYACLTLMPFLRHDSPYYTPLSSSGWFLHSGWLRDMKRTAEKIASELSPGIDGRILKWTIEALDDDHEWEQFFAGVPGFFRSNLNIDPGSSHNELGKALNGFLDRTLTSNLLSEPIKTRRFVTCFNAADATSTVIDRDFFRGVFSGRLGGVLQSVEIGNYLKGWGNNRGQEMGLYTESIVAGVIANVREHDDRWSALAKDQLRISGDVLQDYVARGDSVLLANLIHITPKILLTFEGDRYPAYISSWILRSVSQFDILHTLPKLQHDFCDLWNKVVEEARKRGPDSLSDPIYILRYIRHLYIILHQGTDSCPTEFSSPADGDNILSRISTYPLCDIADHRPGISAQSLVATSSTVS
jgi:Family of unknown function (DUF6535)